MFRLKKKTPTPAPVTYRLPGGMLWEDALVMLDSAHALIAGATGSGKSTTFHALMWTALSASPARRQFILIDTKRGVELKRYRSLPHTIRFAKTTEEALSALRYAEQVMEARLGEMDKTDATMYEGTDLYIVVDELAHLLQNGGQEALRILTTISQLGRAARVHEILATQDPSRKVLAAQLVKNMTCCLGLRCKDSIDSRQVIGRSGCELLPRHGVGILAEGADFRHIGLPLISEEEQAERIAWWSDPQKYLVGRR